MLKDEKNRISAFQFNYSQGIDSLSAQILFMEKKKEKFVIYERILMSQLMEIGHS